MTDQPLTIKPIGPATSHLILGQAFAYVGQWEIPGGGCRISTARKPCLLHRLTMRLVFGWKWIPL